MRRVRARHATTATLGEPSTSLTMAWLLPLPLLSFFLLFLTTRVHGSALTTAISPNERLCFYADVDKAGEKIGVRFTVPSSRATLLILALV